MYIMLYCTEHRSYQESTELVQNVIVTINNLSFYNIPDNYVTKSALRISQCKCVCVCACVCARACCVLCACVHVDGCMRPCTHTHVCMRLCLHAYVNECVHSSHTVIDM